MNISIIIPNYNGEQLLAENLPKVLAAIKEYSGHIEIIISDDASNDMSIPVAEQFISSIKEKHITGLVVKNRDRKNGGFSKNVNRGVAMAKGDIIVLLNTDVFPKKGFLEPLLKHFREDEAVFAVGCMDESIENGKTVLRGRGIGRWEKGFLLHSAGALDASSTLWVSCGSGAFKRVLWQKLGGLNELFNPFYWEDIDLSYRAKKAGWKVLFEKKSVVVHEHRRGTIQTEFTPQYIKKIVYRNQYIFVWVNITDISLCISHVFWLPYHLINSLRSNDSAFFIGFLLALVKLPQILYSKKRMKKLFKMSDKEILSSVQT